MSSEKLDAVTKMVGMVAELQAENAALREELLRQWEHAHDKYCFGSGGKSCLAKKCTWRKPKILEGK